MREARLRMGLPPAMELRIRILGTARLHPGGNPFDGQRRFPPQPRRHRQFLRIALAMAIQVRLFPRIAQQSIFRFEQFSPQGIQRHVITHRLEIPTAAAIDDQGFGAAVEHMAQELVPVIQSDGLGDQEPAHPRHQAGVGRFDHQVKVGAHQTIGRHLKARFLARFGQRLWEILPVHILQKNVLPPVATAHDVVNGPRIFHSHCARHVDDSGGRTAQRPDQTMG